MRRGEEVLEEPFNTRLRLREGQGAELCSRLQHLARLLLYDLFVEIHFQHVVVKMNHHKYTVGVTMYFKVSQSPVWKTAAVCM